MHIELSQWDLNQMVDIFADANFKCIFINQNVSILNKIQFNCVPEGPIGYKAGYSVGLNRQQALICTNNGQLH